MIDAAKLIIDLGINGHPLGKGIEELESIGLIDKIRLRLHTTEDILDLSPNSLNTLSKLLLCYYQQAILDNKQFSDEEAVMIIREIAAYFGKVMVNNSEGKWRTTGSLWGTEIFTEGPINTKKGNEVRTYKNDIVSLGQIASGTWMALQLGVEPKLFKGFKLLTAKKSRERL